MIDLEDMFNAINKAEKYLSNKQLNEVGIELNKKIKILNKFKNKDILLFDCDNCKFCFSNPFDQYYCEKEYDLENDKDCGGKYYVKIKKTIIPDEYGGL